MSTLKNRLKSFFVMSFFNVFSHDHRRTIMNTTPGESDKNRKFQLTALEFKIMPNLQVLAFIYNFVPEHRFGAGQSLSKFFIRAEQIINAFYAQQKV